MSTGAGEADRIGDAERVRLLEEFNATARDYPRHASIPELFAEQVRLGPERTAVVHGDVALSYAELDVWSARVAALLRERGVRRGDRVALMLDKVPEMVAATLAILRTAASYLPIDPGYPLAHVESLLREGDPRLLLTRGPRIGGAGVELVDLADAPLPDGPAPTERAAAEDTAYIMYTSGSTGRPKGVLVSHRAVVRLVKNTDFVALSPQTRILQTGSVAFDAITFELWGALLNGGTVILVPGESILDAAALGGAIRRHAATTMWLTAPLFHRLVDQDPTIFAPLREILVGGDVLSVRHIATAMTACPALAVINGYGPTENTTFSTTHRILRPPTDRIPIGRPIANSTAYVLDPDRKLLPIGVPGELYVGGDGLSDGYLNRPELTESAFVANPFGAGRLYRTGDRVRWLPDGTLDFLGRIDNQVKVRGFRVELTEVEHHLAAADGVREAAVVLRERAGGVEKYLCGFVTADGRLDVTALLTRLRAEHAAHLVPSVLIRLERMPLTGNGKLDRSALAAMEPAEPAGATGDAPRDEVERALAEILCQTLELPGVGVKDSLYELGGSSLTAGILSARIHSVFGVHVSPATILTHPTVEALARVVRGDAAPTTPRIAPAPRRPFYPITFQQRGIHVEQQKDSTARHYNVPVLIDVPHPVDATRLQRAVRGLVARHEVLRTTFPQLGERTVARVHRQVDVPLEPLAEPPGPGFIRPFDLTAGPLLRVGLYQGRARSQVVIDVHHIVVDGITLGLLLDDLTALYEGAELAAPTLPTPPTLRYTDYAIWQSSEDAERLRREQEPFWLTKLADPPAAAALPADFPRAAVRDTSGSLIEFDLGPRRTELIRQFSRRVGVTPFHTLVAAYFLLLARATGQHDLTVGTPVTGRSAPGLDTVAGMFTTTLCLRARVRPDEEFIGFLRTVSQEVVQTHAHQDYPLAQIVDRIVTERDYSRNPLFDTLIAYQDTGLLGRPVIGGRAEPADWLNPYAMFDLNLQIYQTQRSLHAVWGYSTGLFLEQTVLALRDNLIELVDAVLDAPERLVGELLGGPVAAREPQPAGEFIFG